jgi:hypothetical protein
MLFGEYFCLIPEDYFIRFNVRTIYVCVPACRVSECVVWSRTFSCYSVVPLCSYCKLRTCFTSYSVYNTTGRSLSLSLSLSRLLATSVRALKVLDARKYFVRPFSLLPIMATVIFFCYVLFSPFLWQSGGNHFWLRSLSLPATQPSSGNY